MERIELTAEDVNRLAEALDYVAQLNNERAELDQKISRIEEQAAFLPELRVRREELEAQLLEALRDVRVPVPPTDTETR